MHWWEFRCLFNALPDDSQCRKRIDYRSADLSQIKDEARRQQIAKIQRQIALPFEIDEDDMAAIFDGGYNAQNTKTCFKKEMASLSVLRSKNDSV